MNWNAVIEGVVTGVVGAALLAVFALLRYRVSDQIFRWRLWRDLKKNSARFGWIAPAAGKSGGLTVGIRNWVGKTFTVRRVLALTGRDDDDYYIAVPTKDVMSSSPVEFGKLTRKQKRALAKGDASVLPSGKGHGVTTFRAWMSDPTAEGFATVEPYTQRAFLFHLQLFDAKSGDVVPTALRITIEYEAWPGRTKITQKDIQRAADIASNFAKMRKLVRHPQQSEPDKGNKQ